MEAGGPPELTCQLVQPQLSAVDSLRDSVSKYKVERVCVKETEDT